MIYLDNNATTAIDPVVVEAMARCWAEGPLNASSQHRAGRRARTLLDDACVKVATLLGADIARTGGEQLLITSGGTEANVWAFQGLLPVNLPRWVSAIEHPSILVAAQQQASKYQLQASSTVSDALGPDSLGPVHFIPVDSSGRVTIEALEKSLRNGLPDLPTTIHGPRGLVSIMAANNETGILQDLEAIAAVCQGHRLLFHTDATQWIGKLPFHFQSLAKQGLSAVTFTPHKFHGPIGVGGLLLASGIKIDPWLPGGQQQLGLRAGTEAIPLVVGMATALEIAVAGLDSNSSHIKTLRNQFEDALTDSLTGGLSGRRDCVIHGKITPARDSDPRLPGTTSVSFPGIDRQTLLMTLDRVGICCSTGSACTSGSRERRHVLAAMGVPQDEIDSALRFGFSKLSTMSDAQQAAERIIRSVNKLRFR